MQVDPIKPTLKAPGSQRLKLKHDRMLSSLLEFCFQNQLAPLYQGKWRQVWSKQDDSANFFQKAFAFSGIPIYNVITGDNSLENIVDAGPLSLNARATCAAVSDKRLVRRCRLTVSKLVLKAPTVSALETEM